jgi:hypothetical protein
MRSMGVVWKCQLAAMLLLSPAAWSQEGGTAGEKANQEEAKVVKSSIAKDAAKDCCLGACTVNFSKELGVSLGYLSDLGACIHDARTTPDPVALAVAAKSLEAAEKAAGKTASVSAKQIMAEAVKLATLREIEAELKAVAHLVGDDQSGDLLELAEVAAERAKNTEDGEGTKELFGTLRVANHTHECLRIYCDGRYLGEVHEGETANFHVHSHRDPNHFDAYCMEGGELVSHAHLWGHHHSAYWHIHR